jgi:hypothetical protein
MDKNVKQNKSTDIKKAPLKIVNEPKKVETPKGGSVTPLKKNVKTSGNIKKLFAQKSGKIQ